MVEREKNELLEKLEKKPLFIGGPRNVAVGEENVCSSRPGLGPACTPARPARRQRSSSSDRFKKKAAHSAANKVKQSSSAQCSEQTSSQAGSETFHAQEMGRQDTRASRPQAGLGPGQAGSIFFSFSLFKNYLKTFRW